MTSAHLLSAVIAQWAAARPKIRRVWLFGNIDETASRPDGAIDVGLELRPVADSEETLAVWIANCGLWRRELQACTGRAVGLNWLDPDSAMRAARPESDRHTELLYERAS